MTAEKKDIPKFLQGKRVKKIPKVADLQGQSANPTDGFSESRLIAKSIVESIKFDIVIGIVILFSTICVGLEQSWKLEGRSVFLFQVLESLFLLCYILEFALRWYALRKECLQDVWVRFDLALIVLGIFTYWVVEPIFATMDMNRGFGPLLMLRALRLARIAKLARFLSNFKEFWMLTRGLINCAPLVLYTFVIFALCLYTFACVAMEVIGQHPLVEEDDEFRKHAQKYFGSLFASLMSLMRYACLGNTGQVHDLLIEKDPTLAVYFVIVSFVVSLILFHVLGAVIYSSALEQNQQEVDESKSVQAESWTKLISGLRDLFFRLDEDMSGQLSKEELLNIDPVDFQELCAALGHSPKMEPAHVFDALDVDKSGEISIDEFFDGIRDVVLDHAMLENKRMEKQVETIHWRLKEMFSAQYEMKLQLGRMCAEGALPARRPSQRSSCVLPDPIEGDKVRAEQFVKQRSPHIDDTLRARGKAEQEDLPAWALDIVDELRQTWKQCQEIVTQVLIEAGKTDAMYKEAPIPSSSSYSEDAPEAPKTTLDHSDLEGRHSEKVIETI
eukprot:TRINITY_DN61355_c0_g1_i1.p1 TRINITY_DN61355_c0_g1~~TRINITY_DN61355_c0_g1_i1.p1  ORF type:complete len:558 (-),score=101.68 TRINITY_DN61355_c0_g1_i1:70-1743(-)